MNYDYRPKRQNYKAQTTVTLLILLSGAFLGLSGFLPLYSVIWQSVGLLLLLPAIQLVSRYMVSRYLYRLHTDEEGSAELEIFVYRGGAKMQMVFCAQLGEITAQAPLTPKNAHPENGCKRYNYAQDMRPQKATVLSVSRADGACEVLFCPDEYLTRAIADAIAARSAAQASGDQ